MKSLIKTNNEFEKSEERRKTSNYKITSDKQIEQLKLESKKSEEVITSPKKKLMNNFFKDNPKNQQKLRVEIDMPSNQDNQLKYSIITNSSEGQKIIYLKKKDHSKDPSPDPHEGLNRFIEEGEITQKPKSVKKAPIK